MKCLTHIGCFLVLFYSSSLSAQEESRKSEFRGQVIGWTNLNLDKPIQNQWGVRYIPSLTVGTPLNQTWRLDAEMSLNAYGSTLFSEESTKTSGALKPYRLWLRLSTDQFEFRAGLQKINFGSATMIRPLMWFDRIDPRDPLQLTDGVYAALARYYFLNNTNVWFWFLYGNNEPKGWELLPASKKQPEYGGRIQLPLSTGEIALSYHHRQVGPDSLRFQGITGFYSRQPEDRLGLDGKWDVGPGIWFEEVLKHRYNNVLLPDWENYLTLGLDYTFGIGNGLSATVEHFILSSSEELPGISSSTNFTATTLTYPPGMIDMLSAIVYYNWEEQSLYRFISWQRTWDKWTFYLLGYWNPGKIALYRNLEGNYLFAGKGLQVMFVFNH
ncbi:MAG TPA: hypothetical protein VE870_01115 [Bacteroidales bacterium]|nr:hypothetical protein [Bacteroidales bacterium]